MGIDFLAIGHITRDRAAEGFRLGGTVSYAAATALRLGRRPGVLTRGQIEGVAPGVTQVVPAPDDAPASAPLAGVAVHLLPSEVTTTFNNIYHEGRRTQVLEAAAGPIAPAELPTEWADPRVVLLGPVVRELSAGWVSAFPGALLGITPQGWLRQWDAQGHVGPARWAEPAEFLRRADAVILSREDVGSDESYLRELAAGTRLLVVTDGWHGAMLYERGGSFRVPPRAANEVDPTGAGDVFATAFLVRMAETGDAFAAAHFANAVASLSVEGVGMAAIPYRYEVDAWMAANHHLAEVERLRWSTGRS